MDDEHNEFTYTQHIIAESQVAELHEENGRLRERIKALEHSLHTLKTSRLLGVAPLISCNVPGCIYERYDPEKR